MSWKEKIISNYRLRGLMVLAGVVALLAFAASLDPARLERLSSGSQFLPPCGVLVRTGYPCPTCYMTRSFAYMVHGRPDKAFSAQIFGALLFLLVVYLGWGSLLVVVRGQAWRPFWYRWRRRYIFGGLAGIFLGSWIFKLVYGIFISGEFPIGK